MWIFDGHWVVYQLDFRRRSARPPAVCGNLQRALGMFLCMATHLFESQLTLLLAGIHTSASKCVSTNKEEVVMASLFSKIFSRCWGMKPSSKKRRCFRIHGKYWRWSREIHTAPIEYEANEIEFQPGEQLLSRSSHIIRQSCRRTIRLE